MEIPITTEGYEVAKRWLTKYDPEAFKDFAKELSQDGFTFVAFVNQRLKSCPKCLGDCSAANPQIFECPLQDNDLLNVCQRGPSHTDS